MEDVADGNLFDSFDFFIDDIQMVLLQSATKRADWFNRQRERRCEQTSIFSSTEPSDSSPHLPI